VKVYRYLIFVVLFAGAIYLINILNPSNCDLYDGYKKSSFEGVVIKKFIDKKEHSFPFVYVKNENHLEKLNLFYDTTAYKAIYINDSIIKLKNDPWIYKKINHKLWKVKIITDGCQIK